MAEQPHREPERRPVTPPPPPPKKADESKKAKTSENGEEEPVGNALRDDDKQNQFRAPDLKATGTVFGEDIDQPKGETPETPEIPDETHPQTPGGGDGGFHVQQKTK